MPSNTGILDRTDKEVEKRFHELLAQWKQETALVSSTTQRAMHPAYQGIIGLGPRAVPLLLSELKREPCDVFWALQAITGDDPVAPEDHGNIKRMAESWIDWGAAQGLGP